MPAIIGNLPNQVPTNGDLGTMAFREQEQFYPTNNNVSKRNRIINGAMVIDQRNAGAATAGGEFALDRFQTVQTGVTSLVVAAQQVTDTPSNSGFNYSYKYTVTTAATAYGTGGRTGILHRIEGYNTADFMFGTVNAKSVTFSFWVKSSVTGTYSVGFLNNDSTRSYPATYTISAANTWEYKTITIPGCPDGTWLTTNGRGVQVEFCLGADTSRLGTANIWNSAFVTGATGTTLLSNTINATFFITGVQLELGTQATSFEYRQYQQELALCQRYYFKNINASGGNNYIGVGQAQSSSSAFGATMYLPVPMRTVPTTSFSLNTDFGAYNASGTSIAFFTSFTLVAASTNTIIQDSQGGSGLVAGNAATVVYKPNAFYAASAEL